MEWNHKQEPFGDEYFQDFRCTLWGAEAWFSISYYNNGQECQEQLARFVEAADRCLGWLDVHQAEIFAAIEKDGLYEDARNSVQEMVNDTDYYETLTEDGVTYLLLDEEQRIALPYRKEDFFESLRAGALSFAADFKSTEFTADMFLSIEPDVFGGHCIEVFIDGDFSSEKAEYAVNANGLAG